MNRKFYYNDEMEKILGYLVRKSRVDNSYDPTIRSMLCRECQISIDKIISSENFSVGFLPTTTSTIGITELTHSFSYIGFPNETGIKWFLVDPVFAQFNTTAYPLGEGKNIDTTPLYQKEFGKTLDETGYIEMTKENFNNYIDGLIEASRITDEKRIEQIKQKANDDIGLANIILNDQNKNHLQNT